MSLAPTTTPKLGTIIGKLCVGGDWACSNGDFAGLRYVAQQLADYIPEPMHCELLALAAACESDPGDASVLWHRLKGRVYRELGA